MKQTNMRFWMLIIPIIVMSCKINSKGVNADPDVAVSKTVFSVERISKEDFMQAESLSSDYNIEPQMVDSIAHSEIINKIFQDAKERIDGLDSLSRCVIYETVTDKELFCVNSLLYLPEWNLLGIGMPLDDHNNIIWWYDSLNGNAIIGTFYNPTAININGIYVCQVLDDCDVTLDLHFFKKHGRLIYEIQAYKDRNFKSDYFLFGPEEGNFKRIFWYKNNILYLQSYDLDNDEVVYLKISLN